MKVLIFLSAVILFASSIDAISNAKEAEKHKFPFVVSLSIISNSGPKICTGGLLGPEYVITSAYCVEHAIEVDVTLGAHNRTDVYEKGQIRMKSREVILHPDWNPKTLANDLALVKLPSAVTYSSTINKVNLYQKDGDWKPYNVHMFGWGKTTEGGTNSDVLMVATVRVQVDDKCEEIYGSLYDKKAHYCMNPQYSICPGDEGGPITYGHTFGIASFGMASSCTSAKYPSVYTQTWRHLAWLNKYTPVYE